MGLFKSKKDKQFDAIKKLSASALQCTFTVSERIIASIKSELGEEGMILAELLPRLQAIMDAHGGDMPVYFDTEARTFEYHMAVIGDVYYEEEPMVHVSLHEERQQ